MDNVILDIPIGWRISVWYAILKIGVKTQLETKVTSKRVRSGILDCHYINSCCRITVGLLKPRVMPALSDYILLTTCFRQLFSFQGSFHLLGNCNGLCLTIALFSDVILVWIKYFTSTYMLYNKTSIESLSAFSVYVGMFLLK